MNHRSPLSSKPSTRLLLAALACWPLGSACSSDSTVPAKPLTFSVGVKSLDGHAPDSAIELRCDQGGADASAGGAPAAVFSTLAVSVSIETDDPKRVFVLRPANACGSSPRCGYVRIEGLDDSGTVLSGVDTVTTEGVLKLDLDRLPTELRVSLIRGVDQQPLLNPDKTPVVAQVTPSFTRPLECGGPVVGAGGEAPVGGAGGESGAGLGGAAGAADAGAAGAADAGAGAAGASAAGAAGAAQL